MVVSPSGFVLARRGRRCCRRRADVAMVRCCVIGFGSLFIVARQAICRAERRWDLGRHPCHARNVHPWLPANSCWRSVAVRRCSATAFGLSRPARTTRRASTFRSTNSRSSHARSAPASICLCSNRKRGGAPRMCLPRTASCRCWVSTWIVIYVHRRLRWLTTWRTPLATPPFDQPAT